MNTYRQSLLDGLTIGLGYLPVAVAFGITAKPLLTAFETFLMSFMVYGGASQFLALQMLSASSSAAAIIIAIFVLNSRHFVMSFKINYDLKDESLLKKLLISSYVTDESFALSANVEDERKNFINYFIIFITAYIFWVVFSVVGYMAGEIMSEEWVTASGIALYALFIALLVPAIRTHYKYLIVAVLGMILHFIFIEINFIPSGLAIILAMVLAAMFGLVLENRSDRV